MATNGSGIGVPIPLIPPSEPDIREGDIFEIGNRSYPIRSCAEWDWAGGRSIRRLAVKTASTKRNPTLVGGKRGAPTPQLINIKCTPLDQVDPELRQRMALNTPHELLQTFVDGGNVYYHLILEDLKR